MGKRYAGLDGFTISEVAQKLEADYGKVDVLIHSLANGPEVIKPLLETSRRGYLAACSMVSLVQKFAPIMNEGGGVISLTYIASEKVIPKDLKSTDVGQTAAFLVSPLAGAVTGMTMYVDNGMHVMGMVQEVAVAQVSEN